jgi:hypothetical protein
VFLDEANWKFVDERSVKLHHIKTKIGIHQLCWWIPQGGRLIPQGEVLAFVTIVSDLTVHAPACFSCWSADVIYVSD